jgi:hypothetical protein
VSIAEAQVRARADAHLLATLGAHIHPARTFDMGSERLLSLNLISGVYG